MTFYEWRKRYPEIEAAYQRGRAIEEEKLTGLLYAQANAGYSPAAMFLLKTKFHYRDSGPIPGQMEDSPAEKAAKLQAALKAMREADGLA